MKKNKQLILVIMITVLVIIIVLFLFSLKNDESEKKIIKSTKITVNAENVVKEQIVSGLKFKNISMVVNESITILKIDVENTTKKDVEVEEIIINVKNKKGKIITSLTGYVGGIVKAKETKKITNTSDVDLSNAYSLEYEIKAL